jgi:hypothetical protein
MAYERSPRLVKAGIILIEPETAEVVRMIALQYNPESLSHSYEIKGAGASSRLEPLRLIGPPVESISLEAFLDASDQLADAEANPEVASRGIQAAIAQLESLIYPDSGMILANRERAGRGELEILPMEKHLTLLAWGKDRVLPVRITHFSLNEEAFSPDLYPLRARISLTLRVLSVDDLGFDHLGGNLYLRYQQFKENLAAGLRGADRGTLGGVEI